MVSLHIPQWREGKMERTRVYPRQLWIMVEKNSIHSNARSQLWWSLGRQMAALCHQDRT